MSGSFIHVKLLDEAVDVWRPAMAIQIDQMTYRIADQVIPDGEIWEFEPGTLVCVVERLEDKGSYLVAVNAKR